MDNFETRVAACKREIRARSLDGIERRVVPAKVEIRAEGDDSFRVVGHAAVFNELSENLGGFREIIDPGFFDDVLNDDVRALFNHDPNLILARLKVEGVGGLTLKQDDVGLAYDFEPTRTTYATDLRANLDAGVVDQSSFAFRVRRGGDVYEADPDDENGLIRRLLKGGASGLYDVSPVTYPAYPTTDVGLASGPHTCTRCDEACATVGAPDGVCSGCAAELLTQASSPDSEREAERVAPTTADMAETGGADGEGLSAIDLKARLKERNTRLNAGYRA